MTGSGASVAGAIVSGSGHAAATGTGTLIAGGIAAGAGVAPPTGTGALVAGAMFAGAGYVPSIGTGALVAGGIVAATGNEHPRGTGALIAGGILAGASNGGALIAGAVISGSGTAGYGSTAAGIWLRIHTTPPAQVYQVDALRGRMNPLLPMMRVPFTVSDTAAQIGQQNDSFGVTLDRPSLALRSLLSQQAPYGVRVDVMDGGTLSRTGIVSGIDGGAQFSLDCESAAWSDDLPLRTNADLGTFRDLERLPLRYGRNVPGKCVRIGSTGKLWLWADHASARISKAMIDGVQYDGWSWRNDVDATGSPVTLIETVDALSEGDELVAVGDGALDALSGDLMTNPADIIRDLCERGGRTIDRGDLIAFRVECQQRQIEIAGSVYGGSLQAPLASIADSIHAVFGRNLPGLMRLRPRSSPTITIRAADTPTGSAQRAPIATRLRVRYALEDGKPRASVEVRAPSVEVLRGIVLAEVTLPWVHDARTAVDVAERMLAERSRPRYVVRAARNQRRIVPGEVVTATVPALGITGPALVTASTIAERGSTPTLELAAGAAPAIEITSSAVAYTPEAYTGATVATTGSDRVITVTDDAGLPLAGAQCRLDGSLTRVTDGAGRVSFPLSAMPPGQHYIDVIAVGFTPFRLTVTA